MDLNAFARAPQITPLLVKLYDSHKLYSLLDDKQPLARAEIVSAVASLLEVELKPYEQELLTDVLIGLTRQAELDLRQAVAERLADMEDVPLRLVLHLANDEISVASPVLTKSPVFSDLDLIYIIKSQGSEYWQAIAARAGLSDKIMDILVDKKDHDTALVLTQNQRVHLTSHAIAVLAKMAEDSDVLAKPLLLREEIPESIAKALYDHVGQEIKSLIQNYYGIYTEDVMQAVDDVVVDLTERKAEELPPFMPTEQEMKMAKRLQSLGGLNFDAVLHSLKNGELSQFVALFSLYTGLSVAAIYDACAQDSGRKMTVICRAFGILKGDFSTIYMMTQRIRSQDRIMDQHDLLQALRYFDHVKPEAARQIINLHDYS